MQTLMYNTGFGKNRTNTICRMMMMWFEAVCCQHHEKNGLLLWKRCVNDENRLEDVRDLKKIQTKLSFIPLSKDRI